MAGSEHTSRTDPAVLVEWLEPYVLSACAGTTARNALTAGLLAEKLQI